MKQGAIELDRITFQLGLIRLWVDLNWSPPKADPLAAIHSTAKLWKAAGLARGWDVL